MLFPKPVGKRATQFLAFKTALIALICSSFRLKLKLYLVFKFWNRSLSSMFLVLDFGHVRRCWSEDMACANCNIEFEIKPSGHGYKRHSLSSYPTEEIQVSLQTAPFTPPQNKRKGHFLCPECNNLLNGAIGSVKKVEAFKAKTTPNTYIDRKRKTCSSTPLQTPRKKKAVKFDTPSKVFHPPLF